MDVPFTIESELTKQLVIPHGAIDSLWDTIVYIFNPNSQANTVKLEFVNDNGDTVAVQNCSIAANGSGEYNLEDFLPSGNYTGSLNISANYPVTTFAAYKNTEKDPNGSFFAGISAFKTSESSEDPGNIVFSDLVGYYELNSFEIKYDNGYTVTQEDVSVYSGYMKIYSSGYSVQHFEIEGNIVGGTGNFKLVDSDTLEISGSGIEYELSFEFDGEYLTTFLESGAIGQNYSEKDLWRKLSSSPNYVGTYLIDAIKSDGIKNEKFLPFCILGDLLKENSKE